MEEQPHTIPLVAKCGPFTTIIRFNADGECFQPAGVTMPDGTYQLTTAIDRSFGTFTVKNGQVSPDIHDELTEDLLRNVRGALAVFESTGHLPDEFQTASERMDLMLDTWESAIDAIDGRPNRHPSQLRALRAKHSGRDNLLMLAGEMHGVSSRFGTKQNLLQLIDNPTPEKLALSGRTDVAELKLQLARLRLLLVWQPNMLHTVVTPAP